jgi:hypothetical protein
MVLIVSAYSNRFSASPFPRKVKLSVRQNVSLSLCTVVFNIAGNGLQLQEVGDFEAQNCLPPLNLIRSTKLHLTTEPPISCRCCYRAFFFSRCPYIPSYAVKYSAIVSHFVTVNSCYFLSAKKLFKLSNRNFIFFNAKSRNDYGVLHL